MSYILNNEISFYHLSINGTVKHFFITTYKRDEGFTFGGLPYEPFALEKLVYYHDRDFHIVFMQHPASQASA